MKKQYKISLVSYLNTKPFLYGLQHSAIASDILLELDIPSESARKILNHEVDIALAPVAILPQLKEAQILTDFCIGADGKVFSVCIFSEVSMDKIEKIYLDNHSLTSVLLLKILLNEYWHVSPVFEQYEFHSFDVAQGTSAALVIGDKSFLLNRRYPFIYDLSEAWKNYTGLPFVFAAWLSSSSIPIEIEYALNRSFEYGMQHIEKVIQQENGNGLDKNQMRNYLTKNISYTLDDSKKEGLRLFLQKIERYQKEKNTVFF